MSNNKILIDRAVVEIAYQVAWNEDKHDLMQALDVALAASPAMPDDKDKRIAELEAELAAVRSQKPVAWASADLCWMWNDYERSCAAVEGRHRLTLRPLYLAAGAKP